MVDGRYYGRADTTNRQLADAEVRELWRRHQRRSDDASRLLNRETKRDPTPPKLRENAHLFVVAQPHTSHEWMLVDAVPDPGLRAWVSAQRFTHGKYNPSAA